MVSNDELVFNEHQLRSLADAWMMIHETEAVEEAGIPLDTAGFLHIILAYGEAEATLPHDQVCAFVEKTNGRALPSQLSPDYTKPYEEVYHDFVAYIFEQTRDLRLLKTTFGKLKGVPSWVPDLRYLGLNMTWIPPQVKAKLKLSKSRRELQVEGVKISICQALVSPMPKVSHYVSHLRDRINDIKEKSSSHLR
ncbi:hypothetical protein F5Y00DRAFT_263820 [Daldinia vernicosa]|uniref:uncharacterized protein n=1 Tax=Daldinia vernicosa TaxID=114800 RepID=UPI0020081B34|nr:uncharacterized protein F5Y00DRAFT_263820 [Daldinia vernicosa]KAI0847241.1 hypothetical protein F5Y00DRAFT_263820 [Daldinia vernicosa]